MLPIFAKGAAKFYGYAPTFSAALAGMDEVFRWWCANGILLGNEPDLKDVAVDVAIEIALQVGYEQSDINAHLPVMLQKWASVPCKNPSFGRGTTPRATKNDRINKIKSPQACNAAGYVWNPGWNACVPVEAEGQSQPVQRRVGSSAYRFSGPQGLASDRCGPGCFQVPRTGGGYHCFCDLEQQKRVGLKTAQAAGSRTSGGRARQSQPVQRRFSSYRR